MPRRREFAIGRLPYAHPTSGECYYLRILLGVVRGARSFEYLCSVDGVVQPTFKLACLAMGLLDDDNEWGMALTEASAWSDASEMRCLFATILIFCEVQSLKSFGMIIGRLFQMIMSTN